MLDQNWFVQMKIEWMTADVVENTVGSDIVEDSNGETVVVLM